MKKNALRPEPRRDEVYIVTDSLEGNQSGPFERNQIWVGDARVTKSGDLPEGITINFHDRSIGNEVRLASGNSWRALSIDLGAAIDCNIDIGAIKVNFGGLRISFVSNAGRCSNGVRVSVGDGCTFNGATHIIGPLTPGLGVKVGKDCLFASGISIRGSSHHGLWDLESGALLNAERGIDIGDHVWIGDQAVILNKAVVASGSVVGARSVVNKAFCEPNALIVGSPASEKRRGIAWTSTFPEDNGATRRSD